MVKAISDIAHVMKIETIAEYVQDKTVLEEIRTVGLDWAQGYLLGEPVRLDTLLDADTSAGNDLHADKSELPL